MSPTPAVLRKALARGIKPGDICLYHPGGFVYQDNGRVLHHVVTAGHQFTAEQAFRIAAQTEMGLNKIVYVGDDEWEPWPTEESVALWYRWHGTA